jgi:Uma2 family endonuclease
MATQPAHRISVEEYLEREKNALERHEYYNGEVFVMAGNAPAHSSIATNVIASLVNQLADSDCNVRDSNMALRTSPTGLYSYPDAVVSCGNEQFEGNILLNPVLIVEVLSESTENYDRGRKFELYRQIDSFSEYLVIAQDRPYVEHHRRNGRVWTMQVYTERDDSIVLHSVNASLRLAEIYRKLL